MNSGLVIPAYLEKISGSKLKRFSLDGPEDWFAKEEAFDLLLLAALDCMRRIYYLFLLTSSL